MMKFSATQLESKDSAAFRFTKQHPLGELSEISFKLQLTHLAEVQVEMASKSLQIIKHFCCIAMRERA
jgi:hypothetical protein